MKMITEVFKGSFTVEFLMLILLSIFNPALALAIVTIVVYLILSPSEEATQITFLFLVASLLAIALLWIVF